MNAFVVLSVELRKLSHITDTWATKTFLHTYTTVKSYITYCASSVCH